MQLIGLIATAMVGYSTAHAKPLISGEAICPVTTPIGSGAGSFLQAFDDASLQLCGWDKKKLESVPESTAIVVIDLRYLPPPDGNVGHTDVTPANDAPNFNFTPAHPGLKRTLYIRGYPHVRIQLGCFTIQESMDIASLAFLAKEQDFLAFNGNGAVDVDYCGVQEYFLEFWTFNPVQLSTLYFNATAWHRWHNTGQSAETVDGVTLSPQAATEKKWHEFSAVIGAPQAVMVSGIHDLDVTLSAVVIDLMGNNPASASGTVDTDGLHIPIRGGFRVRRLITQFDPRLAPRPIVYRDFTLTTDAEGDPIGATHFDVASPVPAPTNLKLTQAGNTLTLSGSVAKNIVRIEAYRPARTTAYAEYWVAYQQPNQAALDWERMKKDGKFVEYAFTNPNQPNAFAIKDLPLYTMQDFSACEWINCNTTGSESACAFGRGYVVTAFDKDDRPSEVRVTTSDASADDFTTIRSNCEPWNQHQSPPSLTNSQCGPLQHVVNNFCVALQCGADEIIGNHACTSCLGNQTADKNANACVVKSCPAGKVLNGGMCVPIQCGAGEKLSGGICVCDSAKGYSKEFGTGACVKEKVNETDDDDDEDTEDDDDGDQDNDDTGDDDTDDADDDSVCGPGLTRFGTTCLQIPACPPGTLRRGPIGPCVPTGGFNAMPAGPLFPAFVPLAPAKKPGGGCSLVP